MKAPNPILQQRQSALRCLRSLAFSSQQHQRPRALHTVPSLVHNQAFSNDGIGKVFSARGYQIAWQQYQTHLTDRLNDLTAGHPAATKETRDILIATARNPQQAALFNHASMAWNNHHFFSTLLPRSPSATDPPSEPSTILTERLSNSFSSLESFKAQFLATAQAMFGPGFVWLIRNPSARGHLASGIYNTNAGFDPEFSILCTYIAGSPLPSAHPRAQSVDMNTENIHSARNNASPASLPTSTAKFGTPKLADQLANPSLPQAQQTPLIPNITSTYAPGTFGNPDQPPGRLRKAEVCLGVNTWEHCYLHDHGVGAAAKEAYLSAWWDCIDWAAVERNAILNLGQPDFMLAARSRLPNPAMRQKQ